MILQRLEQLVLGDESKLSQKVAKHKRRLSRARRRSQLKHSQHQTADPDSATAGEAADSPEPDHEASQPQRTAEAATSRTPEPSSPGQNK
jgi:hypothetical protein